jgi:hypothetical protein
MAEKPNTVFNLESDFHEKNDITMMVRKSDNLVKLNNKVLTRSFIYPGRIRPGQSSLILFASILTCLPRPQKEQTPDLHEPGSVENNTKMKTHCKDNHKFNKIKHKTK